MTGPMSVFWRGSCALLLLLAGCAAPRQQLESPTTGDGSRRMAVPPGTVRYQLALGEVSSGATPFRRVAPTYPPELLASCPPPQEVPALLIVDERGAVGEVRVAGETQANASRRAFIAAVRAAALQWRFTPLRIDHWAADADGNGHVVDGETRPFSLAYVFRFECLAGKPMVSATPVTDSR